MYEFHSLNCLKVIIGTRFIKMSQVKKFIPKQRREKKKDTTTTAATKIDKKIYDFLTFFVMLENCSNNSNECFSPSLIFAFMATALSKEIIYPHYVRLETPTLMTR